LDKKYKSSSSKEDDDEVEDNDNKEDKDKEETLDTKRHFTLVYKRKKHNALKSRFKEKEQKIHP
jgi:hypothetical protein